MSVVLVGIWLAAVGVADLGRAASDALTRARLVACAGGGGAVLLAGLLGLDLAAGWLLLELLLLTTLLVAWLAASAAALDPRRVPRSRRRGRVVALLAVGAGVAVSLLGVQAVRSDLAWPSWLSRTVASQWSASEVVVVLGVLLAQLATANTVVRLVLDAVGVPATTGEKQLKGGRVLGPMERVFLVGLGAAGELTAAAVVAAAKGLLRFPELQRAHRRHDPHPDGPSDVSEYFLIGSFASWLLALVGVALISLG